MQLTAFFASHPKLAIAFSGGVDSSYLLYAAKSFGCDVHAYFINSPFQPHFELVDAQKLAAQLGVPFTIEPLDLLSDQAVAENPVDRCYSCKRRIFTRLWELARADGYELLCDGTNASDQMNDRPGMQALIELRIASPLRECGLTKEEIRARSKAAGLFTHNKPAYACLATRVPAGTRITLPLLQKIERAEESLFSLGFTDFRVRVFSGAARLQLPEAQFPAALEKQREILGALWEFDGALLDLMPR